MNTKKVKLLRKQLGYHPRIKRKYQKQNTKGSVILVCERAAYLAAKREAAR